MLTDQVADLLRPGGIISRTLSGYESRTGQLAMARRVAQAFDNDERLLVEAGTGTGKTLAYLIPAILSGRKVVVATGSKTLQDQIARVDLPRLQTILAHPFTFAVMKGLSNYICLRRFEEQARQQSLDLRGADALLQVRAWMGKSATGDRAEMVDLPDEDPLWREITATPETRLGARCAYYDRCYVTAMRRQSLSAQIIVTNHHLFFADLALRSRWPEAQVLPPYEAVIFDEAHQIEEVATEFFGLHVSSQRLFALARDVSRARVPPHAQSQVQSVARRIQGASEAFAESLRARLPAPRGGTEEVRVQVPADLWTHDRVPLARYHDLDTVMEETGALFERLAEDDPASLLGPGAGDGQPRPEAALFRGLARRGHSLRLELGDMIEDARRDQIRWVTASRRNVSLRASPVDVAPTLARGFDAHPGPLIFTSATLTAGGSFAFVRGRLGLHDTAAEAVFPSPFRYQEQALLYLAIDLPDPTADSYAVAAAERAYELCRLAGGRALLLFTSFRALRVAETRFRQGSDFPLLVQGEKPRHTLLETLRHQIGSVLLGTQSFWEGVDVPGEALSLVVMDRLPFAVPDEPLVAARIARIREEGGDPFASYQLPRAALSLKQGFGRLIRTGVDRGVVALLDGRIARKGYGPILMSSLPRECPRTEDLGDVARFFAAHPAPPA